MKTPNLDLPPRPPCSQCGEPASQVMSIQLKRLHLHSGQWEGAYNNSTTVETVLCESCTRAAVKVEFKVTATIEKGTKES